MRTFKAPICHFDVPAASKASGIKVVSENEDNHKDGNAARGTY